MIRKWMLNRKEKKEAKEAVSKYKKEIKKTGTSVDIDIKDSSKFFTKKNKIVLGGENFNKKSILLHELGHAQQKKSGSILLKALEHNPKSKIGKIAKALTHKQIRLASEGEAWGRAFVTAKGTDKFNVAASAPIPMASYAIPAALSGVGLAGTIAGGYYLKKHLDKNKIGSKFKKQIGSGEGRWITIRGGRRIFIRNK